MISHLIRKVLIKFYQKCESKSALKLGKGWGTATIKDEVENLGKLIDFTTAELILDVGANKGLYADSIAKVCQNAEIILFEPASENVKHLKGLKAFGDNVTIIQCALSDVEGEFPLYSDQPGSGLASLAKRDLDFKNIPFNYMESVKVIRFYDFWKSELNSRIIDICKLDIEGHELNALKGFSEAIHSTKVIQFEFGGCNLDTRIIFKDIWKFFEKHNFKLFRISPLGLIEISKYSEDLEHYKTTNYIARNQNL